MNCELMGAGMKDCCGNDIKITDLYRLRVATNRHPNCDGTAWGWIEGTSGGYWSDNKKFNHDEALSFVDRATETGCNGHCASCRANDTNQRPMKPHKED